MCCGLGHRRTTTFQELPIAVQLTTVVPRQSRGFIPQATPHSFPLTKPHHTLLSCTILIACLTYKPLFVNQSFTVSIQLFLDLPTKRLLAHSPSKVLLAINPFILHYLHISEPSEHTFNIPFVYTLRHSAQLPYLCIQDFIHSPDAQQTYEVLHLYSPSSRSLLLLP